MTGWYWGTMLGLWAAVAVLGGVVAAYAFLAYRSRPSRPMLYLGFGVLLLSVGPAAVWMGLYTWNDDIATASLGCVALMAGGFALLATAVWTRQSGSPG